MYCRHPALDELWCDILEDNVAPCRRSYLRNSGAHLPGTDDADSANFHALPARP